MYNVESPLYVNRTCSIRSSFAVKGDHSRMVFKLLDQSSLELYITGSAQLSEVSKSICITIRICKNNKAYSERLIKSISWGLNADHSSRRISELSIKTLPLERSHHPVSFSAKMCRIEDQHFGLLGWRI